MKSPMKKQYTR